MSFTYTDDGKAPIVAIEETPTSRRFIYLDKEGEVGPPGTSILDEVLDPLTIAQISDCLTREMTLREMCRILDEPDEESPSLSSIYITDKSTMLIPLPSEETERVFVAGESGCGKTTVARTYADNYNHMFPYNPIWIFARQEADPAFDGLKRHEIVVDSSIPESQQDIDDILSGAISLDQLANSLVIFDDMDNLQEGKLLKAVHKLMNDVVTNGRKKDIHMIYISHLILNYQQTRIILNEANKVFFFPGCGSRQIEAFLKTYASMKAAEIQRIVSLKSRWVMLSRKVPRYIIYEKGIFLL